MLPPFVLKCVDLFFDIFYFTIFYHMILFKYNIIQILYSYTYIYMYIIVYSYIYSTLSRKFASFMVPLPSPPCRRLSLKAHYLVNVLNSLILVSATWNAGDMGHGNVHGIWMGYEWESNGNSMGIYIYVYINGICMGYEWESFGNSMGIYDNICIYNYIYMYI